MYTIQKYGKMILVKDLIEELSLTGLTLYLFRDDTG
jgi:hypothetical protein